MRPSTSSNHSRLSRVRRTIQGKDENQGNNLLFQNGIISQKGPCFNTAVGKTQRAFSKASKFYLVLLIAGYILNLSFFQLIFCVKIKIA
jgi:hypothetical protein